jgi:threonine dehydrogenase-like Zn-dependent dehydrogenase
VFTVRRGCGHCMPCAMNRPDMCATGDYQERGIQGLDGYQCEYVVDKEQYIVNMPPELEPVGVLTEPLSISEKALDEAVRIQSARLPDFQATPDWLYRKRCLVAGLGPVGLLAALALRLRGADVIGLDIVDKQNTRALWLETLGGSYVNGREVSPRQMETTLGGMDVIFESTGVASLEFNLLDALGPNGVYMLTGIPGGDRRLQIGGAELIRSLVLKNQVMVGSVNAARDHYQMAVDDLRDGMLRWGDHLKSLITHRYSPAEIGEVFGNPPAKDEIKAVIEWDGKP